jgi:hypothetical protein
MSPDKKRLWEIATAFLLCWSLLTSMFALYYRYQYTEIKHQLESIIIRVTVIFDYGNGSAYRRQHVEQPTLAGESLLSITVRLAKVKYDTYPTGVLIVSIDGLANNKTRAWLWYRWNQQSMTWLLGETGADKFSPRNGDIIVWYYVALELWPPRPPAPPKATLYKCCLPSIGHEGASPSRTSFLTWVCVAEDISLNKP